MLIAACVLLWDECDLNAMRMPPTWYVYVSLLSAQRRPKRESFLGRFEWSLLFGRDHQGSIHGWQDTLDGRGFVLSLFSSQPPPIMSIKWYINKPLNPTLAGRYVDIEEEEDGGSCGYLRYF